MTSFKILDITIVFAALKNIYLLGLIYPNNGLCQLIPLITHIFNVFLTLCIWLKPHFRFNISWVPITNEFRFDDDYELFRYQTNSFHHSRYSEVLGPCNIVRQNRSILGFFASIRLGTRPP